MFAIQKTSENVEKCTPNLLPCRINHNGPIAAKERYWKPQRENDRTQNAHFRGRKLRGKLIKLPDGYHGAILTKTEKPVPMQQPHVLPMSIDEMEEEEEEDMPEGIKVAEVSKTFDGFVVWGHESLPDSINDPHVKGIEEWISLAEKMHGCTSPSTSGNKP